MDNNPRLDLTDETLLAYALLMGNEIRLVKRLPKTKKTEVLRLFATDSHDRFVPDVAHRSYNAEIAHFVLRQWPARAVKVDPPKAGEKFSTWTVSGAPDGDSVVFESMPLERVGERMNLALRGPKKAGLSPLDEARGKLAWLAANERKNIIEARRAEAVWPPKPGSLRAKAVEWAKACDRFHMSQQTPTSNWSSSVAVSNKPVLAKLKDHAFHLLDIRETHFDKKAKFNEVGEGEVRFDLLFCAVSDTASPHGTLSYEGWSPIEALAGAVAPTKKTTRTARKKA